MIGSSRRLSVPTNHTVSRAASISGSTPTEQSLAQTSEILAGFIDMRIPLAMTAAQATQIVDVIGHSLSPES